MEVIDTLSQASEVSGGASMEAYNYVFIMTVLIMNFLFGLLLFIVFKVAQKKDTQKLFLPLLVSLSVLAFPLFSGLNLWPLSWIPQLSTPYALQFMDNHTR